MLRENLLQSYLRLKNICKKMLRLEWKWIKNETSFDSLIQVKNELSNKTWK